MLESALNNHKHVTIRYEEVRELFNSSLPFKKVDGKIIELKDSELCILNDSGRGICLLFRQITGVYAH